MNNSDSFLRKQSILDSLDICDSFEMRVSLLIDKILQLEDSLSDLQQAYFELLFTIENVYRPHSYKK